jgi:hypothetical protein
MIPLSALIRNTAGKIEFFWDLAQLLEGEDRGYLDYRTWAEILANAEETGAVAMLHDGKPVVSIFGRALYRRQQWLRDSKARRITPAQAEDEFARGEDIVALAAQRMAARRT